MVVAVVTWPVCALLIEIWAPATTAPLESVTVPLIVARPPWANADAFANKNRAIPQRVLYRTRVVIDFPLLSEIVIASGIRTYRRTNWFDRGMLPRR